MARKESDMKTYTKLAAVMLTSAMLSGCMASGGGFTNKDVGTVLGGAAGGILGNQVGGGTGKTIATAGRGASERARRIQREKERRAYEVGRGR